MNTRFPRSLSDAFPADRAASIYYVRRPLLARIFWPVACFAGCVSIGFLIYIGV